MAWIELAALRNRNSRTYEDTATGQRRWSGALGSIHHESSLDSGVFSSPIDATPVRVNNAQLNGWTVTTNGWHYALGKPLTGALANLDGVFGFGGRKGQNWVKFRLDRLGYLHWPTRTWDDIGGAPTYLRTGGHLTRGVNNLTLGPNADALPVEGVGSWSSIWTTPGGGDTSLSWRMDGDRLKTDVTLNQTAREWLAANRPPTTRLSGILSNNRNYSFLIGDTQSTICDSIQKASALLKSLTHDGNKFGLSGLIKYGDCV